MVWHDLIERAKLAQANAYAPYSVYQVGAALRGANGEIYAGTNVENVSFGATLCAERVAIGAMVAGGCKQLTQIVIVTKDGGTPCGICRQVLAEFAPNLSQVQILTVDQAGKSTEYKLSELFPNAFKTELRS